ncbi:hypothetical protein ACHAXR_002450 [Thalassiosira sp. AJA248-18]
MKERGKINTCPNSAAMSVMVAAAPRSAKSLVLAALVASASAFAPIPSGVHRSTALSMADDSVRDAVRELVKTQLNPEGEFEDSASFMDDLGADSLDAVELIMSLEEEFDIEIPDDEVEGITTVQAAIDFVTGKQ